MTKIQSRRRTRLPAARRVERDRHELQSATATARRDDRKWIVVDLGVTFGDQTTPGVEIILPDPTFIEEHADDILGIVLTHAHEDHIGALGWLWPRLQGAALRHALHRLPDPREAARRRARWTRSRSPRCRSAARSRSARSRSSFVTSPTRSPSRTAWPSARRSARCCTPATGRSIPIRCSASRPTSTPSAASATRACWPWSATRTNVFVEGDGRLGGRRPRGADRADRQR